MGYLHLAVKMCGPTQQQDRLRIVFHTRCAIYCQHLLHPFPKNAPNSAHEWSSCVVFIGTCMVGSLVLQNSRTLPALQPSRPHDSNDLISGFGALLATSCFSAGSTVIVQQTVGS